MNSYMESKCNKYSTDTCRFFIKALSSKDRSKKTRYTVKVNVNGESFNLFDTIYDNYNGNLCIGRKRPKQILSLNKTLMNILSGLEKSSDNIRIDGLEDRYVEEIFSTIVSYFKPVFVKKNNVLNNELSSHRRNAYKQKHNWTCENCGVNCSHLSHGYYLRRSFLIQYHHIDGNKYNNPEDDSNGKALCYTCHARQPDHGFMMNRNNSKYPGVDINRCLNTLRKEQDISEVYNSHHGYLYEAMKTNNAPKTIGIWELFKMKMAQISNFFIVI